MKIFSHPRGGWGGGSGLPHSHGQLRLCWQCSILFSYLGVTDTVIPSDSKTTASDISHDLKSTCVTNHFHFRPPSSIRTAAMNSTVVMCWLGHCVLRDKLLTDLIGSWSRNLTCYYWPAEWASIVLLAGVCRL